MYKTELLPICWMEGPKPCSPPHDFSCPIPLPRPPLTRQLHGALRLGEPSLKTTAFIFRDGRLVIFNVFSNLEFLWVTGYSHPVLSSRLPMGANPGLASQTWSLCCLSFFWNGSYPSCNCGTWDHLPCWIHQVSSVLATQNMDHHQYGGHLITGWNAEISDTTPKSNESESARLARTPGVCIHITKWEASGTQLYWLSMSFCLDFRSRLASGWDSALLPFPLQSQSPP